MDQQRERDLAEFIWLSSSCGSGLEPLPDDDWAGPGFMQRNAESTS